MISLFSVLLVLFVIFYILSQKLSRRKSKYFRLFSLISILLLSLTFLPFAINDFFFCEKSEVKTWEEFCFHLDARDLGNSPYLNEEDVDELTFCCCVCYNKKSHLRGLSELLCHKFPNHNTANQFFTPLMFSAYHREGFRACVEAETAEFLNDNHDVLEVWLFLNWEYVYVANPFTPKRSLVILLTACHTIPMLVLRTWCRIK